VSIISALVTSTILSILASLRIGGEIIWNWREVMKAKRELQSWNEVITDYDKLRKD
jgi:hypothetical protein